MENRITYSRDEALNESIKYFNGDTVAASVFVDKYALKSKNGKFLEINPDQMLRRISKEFARIEKTKFKTPLSEEEIYDHIKDFNRIVFQGSPMFGVGNNEQIISLSNCFVVDSPIDSYGSILKCDEELAQISKRRGGVGVDISNLRPKNTPVNNAAITSTGTTSWMERYSNTIREVGQNNRRGALMLTIDINHPDIEDFISIKNDPTKVTGANISVKITDKFMTAVKNNTDFTLQYPTNVPLEDAIIKKTIKAKDLWDKIIYSAWFRAEPGLLFWDRMKNYNIVDCYKDYGFETKSTNPCSEIGLSAYDSCRLMVLNLFSYVKNPFLDNAYFDYDALYKDGMIIQRLMDDMIDLELEKIDGIISKIMSDPESIDIKSRELILWENIKNACFKGRRTGTGFVGIGDVFAALNVGYATEESIKIMTDIQRTIMLSTFRSSCDMAKELGTFPIWNPELEQKSEFLNMIKDEDYNLYQDLIKYGRRNIALLTCAPTGSVSLLTQTTSGIEPLFMLEPYIRRKKINHADNKAKVDFIDQNGDKWEECLIYHNKLKMWMDITGNNNIHDSPYNGYCSHNINWQQSVKLQAAAQKYIDHSISKTVNLPENISIEEVEKIYMTAYESGCKGMTIYRDNCRTGVLISQSNNSEPKNNKINKTTAIKRPKILNAEYHKIVLKGIKYIVFIGFLEEDAYEIFISYNTLNSDNKEVFSSHGKGIIEKSKRGEYYYIEDSIGSIKITHENFNDEDTDALTRLISVALRHGADISFIVHQLEKVNGGLLQSPSKVINRILKKYIKDGTKVHGEKCPQCELENTIERQEGCIICKNCGYSKC